MHLILLGVMQKLLMLWIFGPSKIKLNNTKIDQITKNLLKLKRTQPSDFSRRIRSIRDVIHWKATEFRNFLLYTGPVVLRNILNQEMYDNFLSLHVAITILSSPVYVKIASNVDYAHELLKYFVKTFQIIYDKTFMSHNFPNLLHICDDVKKYGHLDVFSAFRFENYMGILKRKLRRNHKPLQQLARRYAEIEAQAGVNRIKTISRKRLKYSHFRGPLSDEINNIVKQYEVIELKSFSIDCSTPKNNCVLLKNGSAFYVMNIVECKNRNIFLIGKNLLSTGNLYDAPIKSSDLNVKLISVIENLSV